MDQATGMRTSARLRKRRLQKEQQEEENERRKTTIGTACFRPTPGCNNQDQNDCGILPSE